MIGDKQQAPLNRRPLASRSSMWARRLAAWLAGTTVTPNQISLASAVVAAIGGGLIALASSPAAWLAAAAMVQLRLVCNLLDGMVAIEGGKATPAGTLYNEVPDRVADSLLLVPIGYAVGWPWVGWLAALAAAFTAYIRVLGGSIGLPQDFSGIMAKQRRMAALTAGLIAQSAETAFFGSFWSLCIAGLLIAAGSLITCATRIKGLARCLARR